jgi:hypothetical protein
VSDTLAPFPEVTAVTATRKAIARASACTPRLDEGEVAHVGVDVHEASYHVAVVTDRRGLVATRTRPADPGLVVERLKPVSGQVARVVYEDGPTGFGPARRLRAARLAAEVIAPSRAPTMPGPEPESDRLDRRELAIFARKGRLHPVRVPDERKGADRQVARPREQRARKLRVIQQQVEAPLPQHGIAGPAGLTHRTAGSIDAPRQLGLDAERRFCPGRDARRAAACPGAGGPRRPTWRSWPRPTATARRPRRCGRSPVRGRSRR